MADAVIKTYWFLGASFGKQDQTSRFLTQGIWEQRNPSAKEQEWVRAIPIGASIFIKSAYTRKKSLWFNPNQQVVSVMAIKARGVVTHNPQDGLTLTVAWETSFKRKEWYFYTNRTTIWRVNRTDSWMAAELIDFALSDQAQDIPKFCAAPYWRDRFFSPALLSHSEIDHTVDDEPMTLDDTPIGENKIFYGAAGTGKTYHLQQLQQHYTEQLTQQDHATFLAEKLRDLTWRDVICLVFLDEQRLLRVPEIVGHPYFRAKVTASNRTDNINQTVWGTLMRHTPAESTTVKYALKRRADLALFDKDDAGLWHLLDPQDDQLKELYELLDTLKRGAQPTETIERMSFVTFHQSYGYEDFIEGLRPVLNDDSDDGQVRYEIRRGVFVALCERARRDPEHGYALFIDEINRGNVSKILGELITLIELDKREGAPNAIRVRLPYSGDWFSVPANVSIYGSMNSADRSLTPLDTALRRRFEFEEILPDPMLLAGRVIEGIALDELLTVMNARIELLLGRDCLLGHAYFYPVQCFADLQTVMQQKIVPQLQEYFFDDWRKIRWVLNDHRKPAALQLIHEHDPQAQMLALFGEELDVPMQPTYTLNSSAFAQIDSYQMIIG